MRNAAVLAAIALCCISCGTARFQPILRDSTAVARVDSVYVLDSVYIDRIRTIQAKADTVYVTDTRTEYKVKYRDRVKVDTLIVTRTETRTVEVEKELTDWQKFRLKGFWWLAGIIGLWAVWKFGEKGLHL